MKVRNLLVLLILLLTLPSTVALASDDNSRDTPRYTDAVGLLTRQQVDELTAKLDEISARWHFDVVITVTDNVGSVPAHLWAADFFENQGFGYGAERDGIILMVSIEDRQYAFVTTGYGEYAFTDAGQEYMEKFFLPHLKNDEYFEAFIGFADAADDFLQKAEEGNRYREGNTPATDEERRNARIMAAAVSIIVAAVIPLAIISSWTSKLKTVRPRGHAADYVQRNSLMLHTKRDIFLYRRVAKVPRNQGSGGGGGGFSGGFSSSSGRSFSGRSGRF